MTRDERLNIAILILYFAACALKGWRFGFFIAGMALHQKSENQHTLGSSAISEPKVGSMPNSNMD